MVWRRGLRIRAAPHLRLTSTGASPPSRQAPGGDALPGVHPLAEQFRGTRDRHDLGGARTCSPALGGAGKTGIAVSQLGGVRSPVLNAIQPHQGILEGLARGVDLRPAFSLGDSRSDCSRDRLNQIGSCHFAAPRSHRSLADFGSSDGEDEAALDGQVPPLRRVARGFGSAVHPERAWPGGRHRSPDLGEQAHTSPCDGPQFRAGLQQPQELAHPRQVANVATSDASEQSRLVQDRHEPVVAAVPVPSRARGRRLANAAFFSLRSACR